MVGGSSGARTERVSQPWAIGLVALLSLALASGCAAPPRTRPAAPVVPAAPLAPAAPVRPSLTESDRDSLLTQMAACHMLRVVRSGDVRVGDAAVFAAMKRYHVTVEQMLERADALLPLVRRESRVFEKGAEGACARLAEVTGVPSRMVTPPPPEGMKSAPAGGLWVRFQGELQPGLASQIAARLSQEHAVGLIIDSPGGSVAEARKLGRYLRAKGLNVAVDQTCASACIDVLAGGVSRYIVSGARIGIHQSSAPSTVGSHNTGQSYVAGSALYLREMGVDPDLALAAASVPPNKMYWISAQEAIKTRLATEVVRSL